MQEYRLNWHKWIEQKIQNSAVQRGGATVWPYGSGGLIGDSLGPIMHLHDDASEIFYFISGRCRLEIGDSEEFFDPGDFVLVPPEVPHNLWNAGDDDLLVFWLVAPNFVDNKWRTDNFPSGAMARRAIRSHVTDGVDLPSDGQIRSRLLPLEPGQAYQSQTLAHQEAVLYIVKGQADVRVREHSQTLDAHGFVHVPSDSAYSLVPVARSASILLFEMPGS